VRLHAYEFLLRTSPDLARELPTLIDSWIPSTRRPKAARHPVHRVCDNLLTCVDLNEARLTPPSDDILIAVHSDHQPTDGEVRESLRMGLYDSGALQRDGHFEIDEWSSIAIGRAPLLRQALALTGRAAASDLPVLIAGETGTGKELVARLIHRHSSRSNNPCTFVNCGAIPEGLIESDLFGFEAGAFTGAAKGGYSGRLESAAGGTVILDEVGELSPRAQAALLRVLQTGELQRVGGGIKAVSFRLIAIANAPLDEAVAAGRFRRDLYYRIAVLPIHLPPLRRRNGDITLLANHILERLNAANPARPRATLFREALARLDIYVWPGNVRELENVIARALILTAGTSIPAKAIIFDGGIAGDASADEPARRYPDIPTEWEQFLFEHPAGLTSSLWARRFKCSEATARRRLQSLIESGILVRIGDRRGSKYHLANESNELDEQYYDPAGPDEAL